MYEYVQGEVSKRVVLFACTVSLLSLLKKSSLNLTAQDNFWRVSKFSFLKKAFEKMVGLQLQKGATGNGLCGSFPNGFWALTKYNDGIDLILMNDLRQD